MGIFARSEIAEMQTQLKRAGEDREKENADFQTTVADQRATQSLLNKALDVLKGVYAKKEFMQIRAKQEPAGPPPPPGFKKYEKSSGPTVQISNFHGNLEITIGIFARPNFRISVQRLVLGCIEAKFCK